MEIALIVSMVLNVILLLIVINLLMNKSEAEEPAALSRWHIVEIMPDGNEVFQGWDLTDDQVTRLLTEWPTCRRVPTNYKLKKASPAMEIIDIKDMPGFNPAVPNGIDSVTRGAVVVKTINGITSPHCTIHGAMNKVSHDGIWRCVQLGCNEGCYQTLSK